LAHELGTDEPDTQDGDSDGSGRLGGGHARVILVVVVVVVVANGSKEKVA
jgi:hypothetical protein